SRKDGAGALLAADDQLSGLLGSVAAVLTVRPGYEAAVAAALGSAADAVVVAGMDTAVEAIGWLAEEDLGRAGMLVGDGVTDDARWPEWPELPGDSCYAADVVEVPGHLRNALRQMLFKVAVVKDLTDARALLGRLPDVVAVTRDGTLLSTHFVAGGSPAQTSLIEVQAAVEGASARLAEAAHAAERLAFEVSALTEERRAAQQRVDVALAQLHESDAAMAALAENLGQLGSAVRAAQGEYERLCEAITNAERARDDGLAGLADLQQRLSQAEEEPEADPDTTRVQTLEETAKQHRQRETDARLTLRTAEERLRARSGRAEELRNAAQQERQRRRAAS